MKKIKLTKEESALEKEIIKGEWVEVPDREKEISRFQTLAAHFLKNKRQLNPSPTLKTFFDL